jgi:hypothetical protein
MIKRLAGATLLIAALVSAGVPAWAQEGGDFTDEELALLAHFFDLRETFDSYESLTEDVSGISRSEVSFALDDQTQTVGTRVEWQRRATWLQSGGEKNVRADITASVEKKDLSGAQSFVITAEARLVDGLLYVNAAYETPAPDLPPLPEGWIMADDMAASDAYDYLQLDDFRDRSVLLDDEELVKRTVSSVTLEQQEDRQDITLRIDRDGLALVMSASSSSEIDPALAALLYSQLSADSVATMTLWLAEDGTPLQFESRVYQEMSGVDPNAIAPGQFPDGVTMEMVIETNRLETYSEINAPQEPVTAPEVE